MRLAVVTAMLSCALACAPSELASEMPTAELTPTSTPVLPEAEASTACGGDSVADRITRACITACAAAPPSPRVSIEPTCTTVSLPDGRTWHDQLTLQLSSGATTRLDCPRMRFRGQDTPVCVTGFVAGRMRGGCCPPGHVDPSDPECVAEGSVDEMYRRKRAWEWCKSDASPSRPCEPCVWVTGANR